ncbi:hypothetical protein BDZ89DRAFT_1070757 [Hymenopellis radicata]|nr:hypothetical protein BDZ89DRAFT_1070757 [Hymenopellis radicata]
MHIGFLILATLPFGVRTVPIQSSSGPSSITQWGLHPKIYNNDWDGDARIHFAPECDVKIGCGRPRDVHLRCTQVDLSRYGLASSERAQFCIRDVDGYSYR